MERRMKLRKRSRRKAFYIEAKIDREHRVNARTNIHQEYAGLGIEERRDKLNLGSKCL